MDKNHFIKVVLVTVIFVIGLTFSLGYAADSPPAAVRIAAEFGLSNFLSTVPTSELVGMGFKNEPEIKNARLGSPYEQFTITPDALSGYRPGTSLESMVITTEHWLFPVTVNGEPRTTLIVAKMNDHWEAVSLGDARLSNVLSKSEALLKGTESVKIEKYVRIFQANADFMYVQTATGEYLLPLLEQDQLDVVELNMVAGKLAKPEDVIPQLNEIVKKSIKNWKG